MIIRERINAMEILGTVHSLLKQTGRVDEWPGVQRRMKAGDYDNLCRVATEVSCGSIQFEFDDAEEDDQ